MWVEGDELHYLDSGATEYAGIGALVGTPGGAVVGSIWVEGSDFHYIDESGEERTLQIEEIGNADGSALSGSIWIETTGDEAFRWVDEDGTPKENAWHSDTSHSDTSHSDSHSDSAHTNHSDKSHSNVAHGDSHSDTAHSDVAAEAIPAAV